MFGWLAGGVALVWLGRNAIVDVGVGVGVDVVGVVVVVAVACVDADVELLWLVRYPELAGSWLLLLLVGIVVRVVENVDGRGWRVEPRVRVGLEVQLLMGLGLELGGAFRLSGQVAQRILAVRNRGRELKRRLMMLVGGQKSGGRVLLRAEVQVEVQRAVGVRFGVEKGVRVMRMLLVLVLVLLMLMVAI